MRNPLLITLIVAVPLLTVFALACICSFSLVILPPSQREVPVKSDQTLAEGEVKGEADVETLEEIKSYKVTSIVDGDTLHIEIDGMDKTVRLVGIDTPELHHPEKPVECFAQEANDRLSELVLNKEVTIQYDEKQGNQDQYGRELLYIWVGDTFVNDYMIREGYAYAYREIKSDYLDQFIQAEEEAKNNKQGLWGDVCQCTKGQEASRECTECNKATALYYNWDCSTYSAVVDDASCSVLCPTTTTTTLLKSVTTTTLPVTTWTCNCKKSCAQMSSCAEAQYQLNICGCSARDNDKDGVACDSDCQ